MINKPWRLFLPGLTLFLSCEKAVRFSPIKESSALVVEATIEDGQYPLVYLTTSLNFFSRISIQALTGSFVRDAGITISDGTYTQRLKEYSRQAGGYTLYYYTSDSTDPIHAFKGETGKGYSITIASDGQEYSASTTIPVLTKKIRSLYYETDIDRDDSSAVAVFGRFYDPPGLGNYTRYFTRAGNEPYYPGLNSVSDDQVIDGKSYSMRLDKGVDRNTDIDFDTYAFFHKGDTVSVKLCDIDKGVYDFWRTMEYSYSSIGNPFSSPTKVIGNISNGALGYFGGYAVQYSSIIIPE